MLRSLTLTLLTALCFFTSGVFGSPAAEALSERIAPDGVIYADESTFRLAFSGKRDFTIALLLTSESKRLDCEFCRVLGPNFRIMAGSYQIQQASTPQKERDLYFLLADVQDTMDIFRKLGVEHVPNLVFYPPTQSRGEEKQGLAAPRYFVSFSSSSDDITQLASIFKKQGFDITIRKPIPWAKISNTLAGLVFAGFAGFHFRSSLLKVWQAKQIWLAFSLMAVIMFISGHMFNVTRGTPFMGYDGSSLTLIQGQFSSQLAVETQILAVIYAVLAFTTIGLIKFVPKLSTTKAQTVGGVFGAAIILIVYSILIETFKLKSHYPLSLLPIRLF